MPEEKRTGLPDARTQQSEDYSQPGQDVSLER